MYILPAYSCRFCCWCSLMVHLHTKRSKSKAAYCDWHRYGNVCFVAVGRRLWVGYFLKTVHSYTTWWRHQMETFSALLAICAGNSPVTGEFPTQRPVTRGFDAFFDLRLNKRLSKQSWGWWFETPSRPSWRHHNELMNICLTFSSISSYCDLHTIM